MRTMPKVSRGARRERKRDRKTRPGWLTLWRGGFALIIVAVVAAYALAAALWDVRPGSPVGLSYGVLAAVLLLLVALYGARRRTLSLSSRLGVGLSRNWLRLHIYGGTLFLVLVLAHSGFRWPVGAFSWCLWLLSLWTVASGLAGLGLQRWIPRVLSSLSVEVNYDRIPELTVELRRRAEGVVAACGESVQSLYARELAPALAAPRRDPGFFLDPTGGARARLGKLEFLQGLAPDEEKEKLEELEELCRTKLEVDAHYTLQQVLRGWLYLHVPPSVLLVALVILHIVAVLFY